MKSNIKNRNKNKKTNNNVTKKYLVKMITNNNSWNLSSQWNDSRSPGKLTCHPDHSTKLTKIGLPV